MHNLGQFQLAFLILNEMAFYVLNTIFFFEFQSTHGYLIKNFPYMNTMKLCMQKYCTTWKYANDTQRF